MASSIYLASPILLMILFLATEPTCSVRIPTGTTQNGFRVTLTRVPSRKSSPKNQYTINALNNPRNGPKGLDLPIKSRLKAFNDEYTMSLAIGTPPIKFTAVMDTGSDLIWTRCKPTFRFDSSKSSSFSKVNESCDSFQLYDCKSTYGDDKSVSVVLGHETLTSGIKKIPDVIFACGTPTDTDFKYDGIVGMGRGKLSLVSQLKERVFSYCLGSRFHPSETSVLLTGSLASSATLKSGIQTMPLLAQEGKPYYYISLEGISLGEAKLPVSESDFAIKNGDGGMIIDSGTTFMYLEESIVNIISNEFVKQTKLKMSNYKPYDNLEHCFKSPIPDDIHIPKLVFHFKGANWELPKQNYIYEKDGTACLAIIANLANETVSIFGNMQQQNMMVLYNLDKNTLSFKPANCNEL